MKTEDLDDLTKRFALEVADFENKHKVINGGFVTGLFRKYCQILINSNELSAGLIEKEKYNKIWNAAIDAAAEGAKILHKELNPAEDLGYTSKELATWECEYDHFEVSKQSILNLKK